MPWLIGEKSEVGWNVELRQGECFKAIESKERRDYNLIGYTYFY